MFAAEGHNRGLKTVRPRGMDSHTLRRKQPWVEKHPGNPEELVKLQDKAAQNLTKILEETKDHIFLYGQKGIGKSCVTLALVRSHVSTKLHELRVLRLTATKVSAPTGTGYSSVYTAQIMGEPVDLRSGNAVLIPSVCEDHVPAHSKRRRLNSFGSPELPVSRVLKPSAIKDRLTINDVTTMVNDFFRSGSVKHVQGWIIIIDEVDLLTDDDQTKLINMMKSRSSHVRFILECDCFDIYSRIEPLALKCKWVGFDPLPDECVKDHILDICCKEGLRLTLDPKALPGICSLAQGSLFWATTYVQRAARSFRPEIHLKDLEHDLIGPIQLKEVERFFLVCKEGDFIWTKRATIIVVDEYGVSMYLSQLYDIVVEAEGISREQRDKICKRIVAADQELLKGGDVCHEMFDVAGTLMEVLGEIPEDQVVEYRAIWKDYCKQKLVPC